MPQENLAQRPACRLYNHAVVAMVIYRSSINELTEKARSVQPL